MVSKSCQARGEFTAFLYGATGAYNAAGRAGVSGPALLRCRQWRCSVLSDYPLTPEGRSTKLTEGRERREAQGRLSRFFVSFRPFVIPPHRHRPRRQRHARAYSPAPASRAYHHGGARAALGRSATTLPTTGAGGGVVYWLHTDHLGSVSLVTDVGGGKVAERRFLPYGGERYSEGTFPTDVGFTGQRG